MAVQDKSPLVREKIALKIRKQMSWCYVSQHIHPNPLVLLNDAQYSHM